jgi:hypothetical protein
MRFQDTNQFGVLSTYSINATEWMRRMTSLLHRIMIVGIFAIMVFGAGGQPSSALFTSSDQASAYASTGQWAEEDLTIDLELPGPVLDEPAVPASNEESVPVSATPVEEISAPAPIASQPEIVESTPLPIPEAMPAPSVPEVIVPAPEVTPEPVPEVVPAPSTPVEVVVNEPVLVAPQPEVVEEVVISDIAVIVEVVEPFVEPTPESNLGLALDVAEPLTL